MGMGKGKSSIDDLETALTILEGKVYTNIEGDTYYADANRGESDKKLSDARREANEIAEAFANSNTALYDGWTTTADFIGKIEEEINSKIDQYRKEIYAFINNTRLNEESAQHATEQANETAREILNKLGLK